MQKVKDMLSSNDKHHESTGSSYDGPTAPRSGGVSETNGLNNETSSTGLKNGNETGDYHANNRSHGHSHTKDEARLNPEGAETTHDHKHLGHVTHQDIHHHETEEVTKMRDHERNIHHVQHHVQPIADRKDNAEVRHEKSVPVTKIHEKHASDEKDAKQLDSVAGGFRDETTHRPTERTIIDKGEVVNEDVKHHVHHITQPVVQQEVHDNHRIHTTVPIEQVSHEAPIIHKSAVHEPISMDQFKQGGGQLGSGLTHQNAGVLADKDCERTVDGPNA